MQSLGFSTAAFSTKMDEVVVFSWQLFIRALLVCLKAGLNMKTTVEVGGKSHSAGKFWFPLRTSHW